VFSATTKLYLWMYACGAMEKKDSPDRRAFLKGAAMGAAGFIGEPHAVAAQQAQRPEHDHQTVPADVVLRIKALESLLVEKGMVSTADLDAVVDTFEHKVGPRNGARVVARAWIDSAYRQRLLTDGAAAILELGYGGAQGEYMVVLENTPKVHNLVVCTLCSCYPWPTLGLPPAWYKSSGYLARSDRSTRGSPRVWTRLAA